MRFIAARSSATTLSRTGVAAPRPRAPDARCDVDGRSALLVLDVDSGAALDEESDEGLGPDRDRQVQCGLTVLADGVDVGAAIEAERRSVDEIGLGCLLVLISGEASRSADSGCEHQRLSARLRPRLRVGAMRQQQPHRLDVALLRRAHEGCRAGAERPVAAIVHSHEDRCAQDRVRVRAMLEQCLHNADRVQLA